jgi:transposase
VDHQSRSGVCTKKKRRDWLIRLAMAHPAWALGFADEVWWSRVAQPHLASWAEDGAPLRLVARTVARHDPDPKALACYGLLVRQWDDTRQRDERMLLRFVDGRPVSAITTQFLAWCCERLAEQGKTALLLVWDNASWHVSKGVRGWIGQHNRAVKRGEAAIRIIVCPLPTKSPWLNPIEPKWMHAKRWIVEPARLLTADEIAERVCACFGCVHEPHLSMIEEVS